MEDKKRNTKKGLSFYDKMCIGYMKNIEQKKRDLEKKGIRGLGRTPGKHLNPKGYIPGALGAFGIVWGPLTGPKETVEKLVGMKLKKGAKGALLSRRRYVDDNGNVKSGVFAISLMPRTVGPTEKQKWGHERMRVIGKLASEHMTDIIHPIWDPLARKNRKLWDGYRYFMKVNNQNIGNSLNWKKLCISKGNLKPPKFICANGYDKENREIQIFLPRTIGRRPITINGLGIGIFDKITGNFFHISPEEIKEQLEQRLKLYALKPYRLEKTKIDSIMKPLRFTWELKNIRQLSDRRKQRIGKKYTRFYIYNYYKRGISEYSPSICSRVEVRKKSFDGKHGVPISISVIEQLTLHFQNPEHPKVYDKI